MKIAILGSSPIALEAALRFHLHGAALTWYAGQDDFRYFKSPKFDKKSFTSDLGLSVLKEIDQNYDPKDFSWEEWYEKYQGPLLNYLKAHQEVRSEEVVSITKRYLKPNEEIPGRSRFFDLFRLIYKVNPKDFIEQQKETNPEMYQRLTEEFINSLAGSIEMYQDYDLILDLRSDLGRASIAASGRALGEARVTDKVSYGLDSLKKASEIKPTPELRELALVGSSAYAAEILLALTDWMKETRSRLFIATTEEEPFKDFLNKANPETAKKLEQLFTHIDREFEEEINSFTKKLHEWQELDDFVQVKIPKPVEPIPRLNYFSGHNVSAIDELIDKKRMFVTLEKPEFRNGKKHPENNFVDLKTIGVDHILVAHTKRDESFIQLDNLEKGFFSVTPEQLNTKEAWENDFKKLEGIEDEVFKLFSPVDTH